MANLYVRSTDGNNADNGTTWALAKATLAGALAVDAAGDSFWLSQVHSETTAAAIALAFNGTAAAPQRVFCGNDGAAPPTSLNNTAIIATTGASDITVTGYVEFYGVKFLIGNSSSTAYLYVNGPVTFDSCIFECRSTGSGNGIFTGGSLNIHAIFNNCTFKFSHAGQSITAGAGPITINGGSIVSGGTSPTFVFLVSGSQNINVNGFDFSNASSSVKLFNAGANYTGKTVFRDCKLPASWTGLFSGYTNLAGFNGSVEMFNCSSGSTYYRYRKGSAVGQVFDETTLVRTGGANDSVGDYSLRMVTTADAEYKILFVSTPEIVKWNATTGSAITATLEILHDSATDLKDNEIWVEVSYYGTSGELLGATISDAPATLLTAGANQDSSSETWTTTGMTNPNTQALSVTFTPQEVGFVRCIVKLAKASYTVYVDPVVTIT